MRLSDCEKSILDGKEGRLQQVCLENIVRYAGILGAEELCPVSRATVFCGAHRYLEACGSEDFDEVFSRMNLAVDEVIAFERTCTGCAVQSDVAPCERRAFRPFGQSRAFFQKNRRFLERARRAGVTIAGTCAPYLTGWLPVRGEHFVTTESGVTVMGNSLWGAMGNSDGIEAAFWSAVCGRTPKWGLHLEANRAGTHLVRVEAAIDSLVEWDLLGKAIGAQLPPGAIPVIAGEFSGLSFQKLRQLCTTLAVSSSCEMCHLAGYTPEARSVQDAFRGARAKGVLEVDGAALRRAYDSVCDPGEGEVDLVSLGCPHYDIEQIKTAAGYLRGKRVHPGVHFLIWTAYPIKAMADENGYTRLIEQAGGHLCSGSCPATIGEAFLKRRHGLAFDSLKQAGSVKSEVDRPVYFGDALRCIDAAVAGRWRESQRWSASG